MEKKQKNRKSLAFDISRFEVGQDLNRRQAELKRFCDRMPSVSAKTVGVMMSHIKTDDLYETYDLIDRNARNFTALWKWHFMPKKDQRKL